MPQPIIIFANYACVMGASPISPSHQDALKKILSITTSSKWAQISDPPDSLWSMDGLTEYISALNPQTIVYIDGESLRGRPANVAHAVLSGKSFGILRLHRTARSSDGLRGIEYVFHVKGNDVNLVYVNRDHNSDVGQLV